MPVTASSGFPCLEKNLLNSKDFLESVDSNCVLDSGFATFWIFPFGSHVVFYV